MPPCSQPADASPGPLKSSSCVALTRRSVLALLVLIPWLSACTLLRSQRDIHDYEASRRLVGHVQFEASQIRSVVVAAYAADAGHGPPAQAVRLHAPGHFELIVGAGRYRLLAFDDSNSNVTLDADEACSSESQAEAQPVREVPRVARLTVDQAVRACNWPAGTRLSVSGGAMPQRGSSGRLHRLDEEGRAGALGQDGYWRPAEYLQSAGSGMVFVEPYDPARIPVVLVHGAAGSPQDWRHLVAGLDRSRFQAWIFHYASGAALDDCAEQLFRSLADLQAALHPPVLALAAHSMGGLVARRLIISHAAQLPGLRLFVSLSTPWGGDPAAALGARWSPVVVPSWNDLIPQSEFLRSLFASPLPAGVEHHLFFSHRGPSRGGRPNSDGTVSLASQLSWPAQAEATTVLGFDEDHASILQSPAVLRQFQALLDAFARGQGAQASGLRTVPQAITRRAVASPTLDATTQHVAVRP